MQGRAIVNTARYFFSILIACSPKNYTPEQVHLSLTDNASEMVAMWTRCPFTSNCSLIYGENKNNLNLEAPSFFVKFRSGLRNVYSHQATMQNLKPETRYYYKITCEKNSTKVFDFKTLSNDVNKIPNILLVADLGLNSAKSLKSIENEAKENKVDVILHLGDIAYDMFIYPIANEYMRKLEPVASRVPYMVAPGNHEYMPVVGDGGLNYENRFKMPGPYKNQRYSLKVGNVLFIILNSEVYYFSKFKEHDIIDQAKWFNSTMEEANKNRHKVPWVVAIIHRPIYCSASAPFRCPNGSNEKLRRMLDDLFHETGVDLVLYGHNHHYERMHPVHNKKVFGDKSKDIIRNPKASIHIVNGAGGNQEGLNSFMQSNLPDWSAVRLKENGYLRMKAYNYSHLYAEFYSTTMNKVKDHFWIYQENHEPFKKNNNKINTFENYNNLNELAINDMKLNDLKLNDLKLNDIKLNEMNLNDMKMNDLKLNDMNLNDLDEIKINEIKVKKLKQNENKLV